MNEIADRPPSSARLALVPEQFREVLKKPLRLLPPAVRPAALEVWACHRHLKGLETPLPLAGMLSIWIDRFDLRPDDAADVLGRMLDPESIGRHKFASDLTSALAADVATVLRRRKQEADQKQRREADEAAAQNAVPAADLRAMLAGVGRGVNQ